MRTENPNFSPLAWFGIVTLALWFWSRPVPSAFARKMYAAPLFVESAEAPTRTSAELSPFRRPTEAELPRREPPSESLGGQRGGDGEGDVRGRDGHGPGCRAVEDEGGASVLLADDRVVIAVVVEVPRRDAVSRAIEGRPVPLEVHAG